MTDTFHIDTFHIKRRTFLQAMAAGICFPADLVKLDARTPESVFTLKSDRMDWHIDVYTYETGDPIVVLKGKHQMNPEAKANEWVCYQYGHTTPPHPEFWSLTIRQVDPNTVHVCKITYIKAHERNSG